MNDFQILNKLGEGAYSIVYKVKRLVDGNIYALKKVKLLNLSEKEKLNALNEVRILASVKSSFVISYKEAFFDENESCLGIVMEYADKGDLYQKVTEFKNAKVSFEESDVWRIAIQLIKGLKALHDLKILHRDLKSANVFLFNDGSAKLGDLNVSKVARRGLGYTQTGTPYYASPEVWKDQPYDNKSDIWSLGCVIYEMITMRPPFRAENMEGLYNKVIKGQVAKISDRFSTDLAELVKMLIQVSPDARPSCDQILKHPIVQKRIEYFKNYTEENEDQALLQTIRIPKNLLFLSDKLPRANYEKQIVNKKNLSFTKKIGNELPEIRSGGALDPTTIRKKVKQEPSHNPSTNTNDSHNISEVNPNTSTTSKKKQNKENTPSHSAGKNNPLEINKLNTIAEDDNHIPGKVREKSPNRKAVDILSGSGRNNSGRKRDNPLYDDIEYPVHINRKNLSPSGYNQMIYDLPTVVNSNRKVKETQEKNMKIKGKNQVNDHMSNIYKIYAPYMKQNPVKYNKYSIEKKNLNGSIIKGLDKYDYYNVYKPKKIVDMGHKIVPNRKLSPIRKNIMG